MSLLQVCWRAWHDSIKCLGVSSSFPQSLHLASGLWTAWLRILNLTASVSSPWQFTVSLILKLVLDVVMRSPLVVIHNRAGLRSVNALEGVLVNGMPVS